MNLDPQWLQTLKARALQTPRRIRVPLLLGGHVIGSVEPHYLHSIEGHDGAPGPDVLQHTQAPTGDSWQITGDGTLALQQIAHALRAANVGRVRQQWRDEPLAVFGSTGERLATVERGVVRPLGIATRAVHLVGYSPDGRVWVQQRALDKANDPGQWDTMMGGMIAAGDNLQSALERETWEEAGIALSQLQQLRWRGCIATQKPDTPDEDGGYVVEQVDWYQCVVPDQVQPVNQDGEVAQFALLDPSELKCRLQNNEFTIEAALILVQALGQLRGGGPTGSAPA